MPAMDFPSSPINGQTTTDGRYYFDSSVGSTGAWRSTPLPVGGLPAGSIMAWGTNTPPANWLLADGSAVSRSVYSSLFAVIGTQYGAGDGTTTFNLPDLRGRVPVGRNGGTFGTLGATGGAETHTLSVNEMPSHTHIQDAHNHTQNPHSHLSVLNLSLVNTRTAGSNTYNADGSADKSGGIASTTATNNATTATNQNTGGSQPHNNLQPYQVVNYIIKFSAGWTAGDSELATRLGVVETANATTNRSGLVPIIPTSISVGSGSASVSSVGMVSATGATTIKLNGVFTSAYKSYRVVISEGRTSSAGALLLRYVTSGITNSSAAYWYAGVYGASNNTSGAVAAQSATSILLGSHDAISSNFHFSSTIDIHSPLSTQLTNATIQTMSYVNGTLGFVGYNHGGDFNGLQGFDGLELVENAGNFSGNIQVYGYR